MTANNQDALRSALEKINRLSRTEHGEDLKSQACKLLPIGQAARKALAALRLPSQESPTAGLPEDVVRLVIAARRMLYDADDRNVGMDEALEAFASRVPWTDEPDTPTVGEANHQEQTTWPTNVQTNLGVRRGRAGMKRVEVASYPVSIFIAGSVWQAETTCMQYAEEVGFCATVTETAYCHTSGYDPGVVVGLIHYPRFPSTPDAIWAHAEALAARLCRDLKQQSYTIQAPDKTVWFSHRPEDATLAQPATMQHKQIATDELSETIVTQPATREDETKGIDYQALGYPLTIGLTDWFIRNADRKNKDAAINRDPAYFGDECAALIYGAALSDSAKAGA